MRGFFVGVWMVPVSPLPFMGEGHQMPLRGDFQSSLISMLGIAGLPAWAMRAPTLRAKS